MPYGSICFPVTWRSRSCSFWNSFAQVSTVLDTGKFVWALSLSPSLRCVHSYPPFTDDCIHTSFPIPAPADDFQIHVYPYSKLPFYSLPALSTNAPLESCLEGVFVRRQGATPDREREREYCRNCFHINGWPLHNRICGQLQNLYWLRNMEKEATKRNWTILRFQVAGSSSSIDNSYLGYTPHPATVTYSHH